MGDDSSRGHQEDAELDAARTVARWAELAASEDIRTILAAMYWFKNFTGEPAGFEVENALKFSDKFLKLVKERSR